MGLNTPLITLLAGAALGAGLLIASTMATPPAKSPYAALATPGATAGTGGGTATNAGAATSPSPALSSPAAPHVPGRADFTGPVIGSGATVAVSVRGGKAIGFVCTTSGTATWLSGAAGAGLFQLSGPGRARLTGSYLDHRATGRARAHGIQYRFAIPRVHQAGLHAAIVNRTATACQPSAAPVNNGGGNGGGGGGGSDNGGGHHHGGG
jgi:serine/threonine-protein kinase